MLGARPACRGGELPMVCSRVAERIASFCGWASVLALAGCAHAPPVVPRDTLAVADGATQLVDRTTQLARLVIGQGAQLVESQGSSLTLTVNGVGTALRPGTYEGAVVLTPTENFVEQFNDMGVNESYIYRSALFVDNGARVAAKSVAAAVVGGSITDSAASDVAITSNEDKFNGILVTGNSNYTISNAKLRFTGNGGNDFKGFGAAIKTGGTARVTIDNASIITTGVVRTAVFVGGDSDVTVNNSTIEVHNGTLPADYKGGPITGGGGVMLEPPWVLGIVGNVRATNVVANGTAHYNNSHISAQGWGALSTDATQNVRLYATHSVIETIESGYGAYADGQSLDTFGACTFRVADYGLIMTGGSGIFTDGTVVNSGRIGVMMHSGGVGTLTIDKGSVFNTKEAVLQVKSSYPRIVIDNAQLNSASGVILEAFVNDDPHAGAGPAAPRGAGAPGGPPGGGPPGGPPGAMPAPRDIVVLLRSVTLSGDILDAMTSLAGLQVSLEDASLTGAISTSTVAPTHGTPTARTYGLIGRMTHTLRRVPAAHGVEVTLGHGARWVVTKTSYLAGLTIGEGAHLTTPVGYGLAITVDGKDMPVAAGHYRGAVVLSVTRL